MEPKTPAPRFQVGDVVYLKSGGSPMTVTDHAADGQIRCEWHAEDGRGCTDFYPPGALDHKSPDDREPATETEAAEPQREPIQPVRATVVVRCYKDGRFALRSHHLNGAWGLVSAEGETLSRFLGRVRHHLRCKLSEPIEQYVETQHGDRVETITL